MNPTVPGISVQEVAQKRANGDSFVLLDVREPNELNYANLGEGVQLLPLSQLAGLGLTAVPAELAADKDAEVVVFCHHGGRSAQVGAWLLHHGWTNVRNMEGGIHAYAVEVDPSLGRY